MAELVMLVSFLFGALMVLIIDKIGDDTHYCNSSYSRGKNSLDIRLDKAEYEITKVEFCYCKNNLGHIAKYTLKNYYIKKKDNVVCQELFLYDEIGKYNIGDKLTLVNLAKYNNDFIIQKAVGYLTSRTGLYTDDIENFKNYMKGE